MKYPPIYENRHKVHGRFGRRLLRNTMLFTLALILLVATIQISAFFLLANPKEEPPKADLMVVFPGGDQNRQAKAWTLAEKGLASNLAIINSTANRLKNQAKKHQNLNNLTLLEGGTSRSTFEDVYKTAEIIQKHNFSSLILITSSYHMPRSLFLLKTHLFSLGIKIDIDYVAVPLQNRTNSFATLGLYYNEILKIWGSVVELTGYHFTGKLMNDSPFFQKTSRIAHKYLLYSS